MPIKSTAAKVNVAFDFPLEAWENPNGILDAFAGVYGYQQNLPDRSDPTGLATIPNTQTKSQFAVQQIMNFVNQTWRQYNQEAAEQTSRAAVEAALETSEKLVRDNTTILITGETVV